MLGLAASMRLRSFAASLFVALASGAGSGCSLGNVAHASCSGDAACAAAFGLGSQCSSGFCSDPGACATGNDCRAQFGGGACVSAVCTPTIPVDPACDQISEPEGLLGGPAVGDSAPLLIGAVFSLAEPHDQAVVTAVRLGVREINRSGGMIDGKQLGLVVCDNGGPMDTATGAARTAMTDHAFDYLAGTLGVPYLVGPLTSADAIDMINELLLQAYPTVIISPSATSPQLTGIDDRLHKGDPYGLFWRTCPSDELQGTVLADDVIGPDKTISTVSVVYIQDAYGEGLSTVFREEYGLSKSILFPYDDTTLASPAALATLAGSVDAAGADAVLLIAEEGDIAVSIMEAMAGKSVATKKFFFTDGTMDVGLLAPGLPAEVKAIVAAAKGTAPADPSGPNYDLFATNLTAAFGLDASSFSFLAQAYDATYVGAYGTLYASQNGPAFNGLGVVSGMARLSITGAPVVNVSPTEWNNAKGYLTSNPGQIDIDGTSGPLHFDPTTGEAPAPIEEWAEAPDGGGFVTLQVFNPP
jgi:branched-chain amino acid transport system substrate-binding protein